MKRSRRLMLALTAAVLSAGAVAFFIVIPHELDRHRNGLGAGITESAPPSIPSLHADLRIVDLHADTLLWDRDLLKYGNRGHVDLPRLQQGNVALQVFSVVTKTPRGLNYEGNRGDTDNITLLALAQRWPLSTLTSLSERALYQAGRLREAAAASKGQLRLIRNARELRTFLRDRAGDRELTGALLLLEGGHALEGDLSRLDLLDEAGFRILAPAHMFDSELSGSQQGIDRGGLTDLGRRWLAEMERRRLIVDLAHISNRAIDEVLSLTKRPVLISHTGVKAVCDNNRNLSDDQLRRIAAGGGLIGIGFWDEANCGATLEHVARSLRHAVGIAGVDHVALGSDWDGFVSTPIDAARMGWLTAKLVATGWSDEDIRKVMGENALRFLEGNLPP